MEENKITKRTRRDGVNPSQQIALLENKSTKAITIAEDIKQQIIEGDRDQSIKSIAFLKKLEKVVKVLLADTDVKATMIEHIEMFHAEGKKEILGVKVGLMNSVRYDYLSSGHPEYSEIDDIIRQLKVRKKQIEEELRAIPQGESKEVIFRKLPSLETVIINDYVTVEAPRKINTRTTKFTA